MLTTSVKQTKDLAKDLKKHRIFALQGDLGSGKTTFVQGLAECLGIKQRITSPTFVIMKRYGRFYHIDCYRVNNSKELLDLGFKDIVSKKDNIVCIEWAEKIKDIIPKQAVWLRFEFVSENKRKIIIDKQK